MSALREATQLEKTEAGQPFYTFKCPHCKILTQIFVHEIACNMFRHASQSTNWNSNIGPHTSKAIIDQLLVQNRLVGCGKPFRFMPDRAFVEPCEYG